MNTTSSRGLPRTQSRGFISLDLILLLVIGLAALGGAGWYVSQKDLASEQYTATATTSSQSVERADKILQPAPVQDNGVKASNSSAVFDAEKLKVGDMVGVFVAKEVRPYKPYHPEGVDNPYEFNEPQGSNNIYARFSGITTLVGSFAHGRELEIGTGFFITDLTLDSRASLPQQVRDEGGRSGFSISNQDAIRGDFKTGDKVEVVITEYEYIGFPAGGINKASVQSVRKIP